MYVLYFCISDSICDDKHSPPPCLYKKREKEQFHSPFSKSTNNVIRSSPPRHHTTQMAHIDWKPITDPGLELLEAVASYDIPWCQKILSNFEQTHKSTYQKQPMTIEDASNPNIETKYKTYPGIVDLINTTRDEDGYTALMLAFQNPTQHGAISMINFLLENGGDITRVPPRIRSRIQFDDGTQTGGSFKTGVSFDKHLKKETLLLSKWDVEEKKRKEMYVGLIPDDLPTTNPNQIEANRFKDEELKRDGLFYKRETGRFDGGKKQRKMYT